MSGKFIGFFRLLEACGRPGCPVCRCVTEGSRHYLDAIIREQVTDPDLRRRLRASWGFCNWHTWMLLDVETSASGAAILYEDMLRVATDRMRRLGTPAGPRLGIGRPGWWRRFAGWWRGSGSPAARLYRGRPSCPGCVQAAAVEAGYLDTVLEFVDDEAFADAYRLSGGLCVPHLVQAVDRAPGSRRAEALVGGTLERWTRLRADLESFVRKHDYRNRSPFTEAEGDSCSRAFSTVAGAKALFGNDLHGRGGLDPRPACPRAGEVARARGADHASPA